MSNANPEPRMSAPSRLAARAAAIAPRIGGLGLRVLAADVEVALARAGRERGDRHRLDDRERVALEQDAVLERAGLRLVGVADEVVRLRRLCRDGGPLATGRERRAAATHQLGRGDLGDDCLGADLERPSQGRIAAMGAVVVERRGVDDADPAQQPERRVTRLGDRAGRRATSPAPPSSRATMPAASTGAALATIGLLARCSDQRCRGAVAQPQARRSQPADPAVADLRRPLARSSAPTSADLSSAPASRHAMSSQTWATTGARGFVANSA